MFDVILCIVGGGMIVVEVIEVLENYDVILFILGDVFFVDVFEVVIDICCKMLGNFGVGYNYIDVDVVVKYGVIVLNMFDVLIDVMVDIGWMLILVMV